MEKDNNNLNLIGTRIKNMRLENNFTQKDLANKLGLKNDTAIANYESGYSIPKDDIKLKMCSLFNCSMDYLMGESNYKTKEEELDVFLKQQTANVILKTIHRYYYEFVLPCELKEDDIDTIIDILSNVEKEKTRQRLNDYEATFSDQEKRKKIHEFLNIIIKEVVNTLTRNDVYHSLITQIDNKSNKNDKLFLIPILGKIAAGKPILAEQYIEGYLPMDPNIYGMTTPDDYFYLLVSGESMNLKIHNGNYALVHKQETAEDGDIVVAIVNGDDEATLKKYKRISEDTVALEPMSTLPMEPIYINLKDTNFKIIGKAIGQFGKF